MKRIRAVVLMLLAVFCVSAVAAVAASANEGEFVNSSGKALVKNKFTFKSGETKLVTALGSIICKKDEGSGVALTSTTGEQAVKFKECKSSLLGTCTGGKEGTKEAGTGEIWLGVSLRTRRKSQPEGEVLLLVSILETENNPKGIFSFKCGSTTVEVKGSFLVPAGASGKLSKTYSFTAKQSKGKQEPSEYENEAKEKKTDNLESNFGLGFEKAGQEGVEEVTFEEEAEFK